MNYYDTLSFHIVSVLFMLAGCLLYATDQQKVTYKVLAIVGTVITGVTGFMLFQRFGMPLKGPYPIWIMVKSTIWLVVVLITLIVGIKFQKKARLLVWPILFLMSIAAAISIYKPL